MPLKLTNAEAVARVILQEWISVYGCPSVITIDRGSQFQSALFSEFVSLLGAKHITTTAYHPCANGLVERFHRQLKASLTASTDNRSWLDSNVGP